MEVPCTRGDRPPVLSTSTPERDGTINRIIGSSRPHQEDQIGPSSPRLSRALSPSAVVVAPTARARARVEVMIMTGLVRSPSAKRGKTAQIPTSSRPAGPVRHADLRQSSSAFARAGDLRDRARCRPNPTTSTSRSRHLLHREMTWDSSTRFVGAPRVTARRLQEGLMPPRGRRARAARSPGAGREGRQAGAFELLAMKAWSARELSGAPTSGRSAEIAAPWWTSCRPAAMSTKAFARSGRKRAPAAGRSAAAASARAGPEGNPARVAGWPSRPPSSSRRGRALPRGRPPPAARPARAARGAAAPALRDFS